MAAMDESSKVLLGIAFLALIGFLVFAYRGLLINPQNLGSGMSHDLRLIRDTEGRVIAIVMLNPGELPVQQGPMSMQLVEPSYRLLR